MLANKVLAASATTPTSPIYVEDVFSTWLYTGNGSTQTITNGIDLAGEGGLVWIKNRSGPAVNHVLTDTARGADKLLYSNTVDGQVNGTWGVNSFNNTGFGITGTDLVNNSIGATYASWTFRKAAKFFDVVTYTGNGTNRTIAHNLGSYPGCIIIKRTDNTINSDWVVYHQGLASPESCYVLLNQQALRTTDPTRWNNTAPTATEFSVGTDGSVNASGGTYVAYLFSRGNYDGGFGANGDQDVIACGNYLGTGSTNQFINLGWEPQFILIARSAWNVPGPWIMCDNTRGTVTGGNDPVLVANTSNAEDAAFGSMNMVDFNPTGFTVNNGNYTNWLNAEHIYIAIRRGPMKTPTAATQVFGLSARTGTGVNATISGGQLADAVYIKNRGAAVGSLFSSRLTGTGYLVSSSTAVETAAGTTILQSNPWDVMDGVKVGTTSTITNFSGNTYINYLFRRAPGFFDVITYTGTGVARTLSHNLGVLPELAIIKNRTGAIQNWSVGHFPTLLRGALNSTTSAFTALSPTDIHYPTSPGNTTSTIALGTSTVVNGSGNTYIAYLFASLPGISKVGSYTGTGATLNIDCGFTSGARFVLIKRTDTTGDGWFAWDTARGIVNGNDPYILFNAGSIETIATDFIDPLNSGFQISSTAPTGINGLGGNFIYLAIA